MAARLPQEVQDEIRRTFELLDANKSGTLSRDEIAKVVRNTGCNPTEQELEEMFRSIDSGGYGEVQYKDFLEYYAKNFYDPSRDNEQETLEAFRMFDENGDGYIDLGELKKIMTQLGEENLSDAEFKQMIKEVDTDFDGRVNYEEFVRMINQKF